MLLATTTTTTTATARTTMNLEKITVDQLMIIFHGLLYNRHRQSLVDKFGELTETDDYENRMSIQDLRKLVDRLFLSAPLPHELREDLPSNIEKPKKSGPSKNNKMVLRFPSWFLRELDWKPNDALERWGTAGVILESDWDYNGTKNGPKDVRGFLQRLWDEEKEWVDYGEDDGEHKFFIVIVKAYNAWVRKENRRLSSVK